MEPRFFQNIKKCIAVKDDAENWNDSTSRAIYRICESWMAKYTDSLFAWAVAVTAPVIESVMDTNVTRSEMEDCEEKLRIEAHKTSKSQLIATALPNIDVANEYVPSFAAASTTRGSLSSFNSKQNVLSNRAKPNSDPNIKAELPNGTSSIRSLSRNTISPKALVDGETILGII
jgi:hypothetical protein